jgi:hypothetical protein
MHIQEEMRAFSPSNLLYALTKIIEAEIITSNHIVGIQSCVFFSIQYEQPIYLFYNMMLQFNIET